MSFPEALVAALADRYTIERELGSGGMMTAGIPRSCTLDSARQPCEHSHYGYVHSQYGNVFC